MTTPSAPRFSIAICTYNRAAALAQVLRDLAGQEGIDLGDVEVVVVNNCSTDDTESVLASWCDRLPVRTVTEERQGTVFARNRALEAVGGDVTLFLDDDVRVRSNWLARYRTLFADAAIRAAAGPVISTWPDLVPSWIGDTANPPFPGVTVHFVPASEARWIGTDGPHPFTANIGFRTELGRAIRFREDIGHVGGKPMGGDDMDFCRRFTIAFGPILFDPGPVVEHPVEPRRMTLRHTFGYLYRGAIAESWYAPPPASDRRLGPIPLWLFRSAARSFGSAVGGLLRVDSRQIVVGLGGVVRAAGVARGLMSGTAR